jgi:hypothetical protein
MKKITTTIVLILYNFLTPTIFSVIPLFYFNQVNIYLTYLSFFIGYVLVFFITKPVYNIFSVNKKSASINTIIISAICLLLMDTSVFLDDGFNTQKIQQNIFHIVIWCSLLYHFVFKKSDK